MRWILQTLILIIPTPLAGQQPEWLAAAIRTGQKDRIRPLSLDRKILGIPAATFGGLTTPFLRVAIAASEAKAKMIPFDSSRVTEEMLAPTLIVYAYPQIGKKMSDGHRSVEHVVLIKTGSKDAADAIQPTTITPFDESASNLFGATIREEGRIASFPLDAFREGMSILIMYESRTLVKDRFEFKIDRKMLDGSSPP